MNFCKLLKVIKEHYIYLRTINTNENFFLMIGNRKVVGIFASNDLE